VLTLPGIATVEFLRGTFGQEVPVELCTTNDPGVQQLYEEFGGLFRANARSAQELRFTLDSAPLSPTVRLTLAVPPDLSSTLPTGFGLQVLPAVRVARQ
jgi:hypothetical protein